MEFPAFFKSLHPRMVMIEKDPEFFEMWPESQLDWAYMLSKISDTKWVVNGFRDASMPAYETMEATYCLIDDEWVCVQL